MEETMTKNEDQPNSADKFIKQARRRDVLIYTVLSSAEDRDRLL